MYNAVPPQFAVESVSKKIGVRYMAYMDEDSVCKTCTAVTLIELETCPT